MQSNELERLGRIEERVDGIAQDVTEIKTGMRDNSVELRDAVKEFTKSLGNLHKDFLLRLEAEKITAQRDEERDETKGRLDDLEKRTRKLENWRYWLTGGLGVVLILITVLTALIRDGVIK